VIRLPAQWRHRRVARSLYGRTVRTQRWRLIERRDGSRELYDHSTDTAEYHNVIANPVHEALVERLHGMLETEFGPMTKAPAGKVKAN
jgi:hypothetical protein